MTDGDNAALASRVAAGQPITTEDVTAVSGEALRSLFLAWGASTRHLDRTFSGLREAAEPPRLEHGAILPAGIVIDGGPARDITIVPGGDEVGRIIDLSYLARSAEGPLPPLIIRNCKIDGTLKLTGSRFAFISITDCDIRRIDADHCRIDNHCELARLSALPDDRAEIAVAQISMVAARIDGSLDLHGSKLQAPLLADLPVCGKSADHFALLLGSAEIAGQLSLTDGFEALGGVSLRQAAVHKSVLIEGARLEVLTEIGGYETSPTNADADGSLSTMPSALDLSGAQITGGVFVESELIGRVNFRDTLIDGSLELRAISNCPVLRPPLRDSSRDAGSASRTILDLHSATVTGTVHLDQLHLKGPEESDTSPSMRPMLVDLRRLSCRVFDDNEARVWNDLGHPENWRLLLEGVTFESLGRSGQGEQARPAAKNAIARWADNVASRREMLMAFCPPLARRWKNYSKLAAANEYSPQPFETFARAYFHDGQRPMATEVAKEQLSLRFHHAALVIKQRIRDGRSIGFAICLIVSAILALLGNTNKIANTPFDLVHIVPLSMSLLIWWVVTAFLLGTALWASDRIILFFGWTFKKFFAFGLRPQAAMATLAGCLVFGVVGTVFATEYGALDLVSNVDERLGARYSDRASESEGVGATLARQALATAHQISEEGCNHPGRNRIDEAIYAFDVFLPVVDLRQECAFAFEPSHGRWWRLIKSTYALLGWIVVSLTLLSLSGVLRRDIEG